MASALPPRHGGRALDIPSAHRSRGTDVIWSAPTCPATATRVQAGRHYQERPADVAPKPHERGIDQRLRQAGRDQSPGGAELPQRRRSHAMPSGSRPVPPLGRPPRPLKHPGRTLADPRRSAWAPRSSPRLPHCWLGASVAFTRGRVTGLGGHRSRLAGRMTRDLARGLNRHLGRPGFGGWSACRRHQPPKSGSGPSIESASGTPTAVACKSGRSSLPVPGRRACTRSRRPGLAVRARSPLTGAARRICDNWPASADADTGGWPVRVPTPRTAAIRLSCAGGSDRRTLPT